MDIFLKIQLTGLLIWVLMLVVDIAFDINDRKINKHCWYGNIAGAILVINGVGWLVYAIACIWI